MSSDDMTMEDALIALHAGTDRQGPGDEAFALDLLRRLPTPPTGGTLADLGCGTGAAGLLLARHFRRPVLCVDSSEAFLKTLTLRAEARGLGSLVTTLRADMGSLDPKAHRFDLLWSEGAAYNLTFEGALRSWRPLMARNGLAVVSEMTWFGPDRPREALEFWSAAYPAMADEQSNRASAERHGFACLFTARLPTAAWWTGYYDPLLLRLDACAGSPSKTMQLAISETRQEIDLFRKFSDFYGYSFYALQAV
ncbi:MAG: class I SAM-dependent methyltransferase [Rhodospirillales bacterium]